MGRPKDKTWYVDNPDPKFRGEFLPGERKRVRHLLMSRVDTKNGPIMPHMTTRCHLTDRSPGPNKPHAQLAFGRAGAEIRTSPHRLAWIFEHGIIPPWHGVYHKCDNPLCCNHEHLFCGRASANSKDRDNKGRGNLCAANRAI